VPVLIEGLNIVKSIDNSVPGILSLVSLGINKISCPSKTTNTVFKYGLKIFLVSVD